MALDVHVLDSETARVVNWPKCQFEQTIHNAIFLGGVLEGDQYPQLWRMQDYYADARYSGADLRGLLEELQEVLPKFGCDAEVHQVLRRFLEVCREAVSRDQVVLCLCD
jgi:hypothetical protein